MQVKVKKLQDNAVIPTYAHVGDVGMDLTAISVEYDPDKDMYIYHTGLAFESDFNYGQFLFPRSSNRKTDAYLCNHVGIADSAIYRGEIMLCFKNRTSIKEIFEQNLNNLFRVAIEESLTKGNSAEEALLNAIEAVNEMRTKFESDRNKIALDFAPYKVGDRIAQMVFLQYPTVELVEVDELSETERGANGFGSTDKQK